MKKDAKVDLPVGTTHQTSLLGRVVGGEVVEVDEDLIERIPWLEPVTDWSLPKKEEEEEPTVEVVELENFQDFEEAIEDLVDENTRVELEELAEAYGVADPESYRTKKDLAEAMLMGEDEEEDPDA